MTCHVPELTDQHEWVPQKAWTMNHERTTQAKRHEPIPFAGTQSGWLYTTRLITPKRLGSTLRLVASLHSVHPSMHGCRLSLTSLNASLTPGAAKTAHKICMRGAHTTLVCHYTKIAIFFERDGGHVTLVDVITQPTLSAWAGRAVGLGTKPAIWLVAFDLNWDLNYSA